MLIKQHLWRTASGKLVATGHLEAETLAYPAGTELTPAEVAADPVLAELVAAQRNTPKPAK